MAAPTYNNAASVADTDGNSTATVALTANAGSNRFLEVWVGVGGGTPPNPSGVTWGGQALTQRGTTATGATFWKLSKWYLKEANFPGGATGNIVATNAAGTDEVAVMALVTNGVNQTNPYRNASQASEDDGVSLTPSITVTSNANDLVTGGLWASINAGVITAVASTAGTERADTGPVGGGYEIGSAATVAGSSPTLTWSVSSSELLATLMMADSLQEAAADSTAPTYSVNPHLIQQDATTLTVSAVAADETDTAVDHYLGVYTDGSTPLAAEIKAAGGTGYIASSAKTNIANNVAVTFDQITGLTPPVDVWCTVEEHGATKNPSSPFKIDVAPTLAVVRPVIVASQAAMRGTNW